MGFREIVHRTWEGHQLFSALVELTYRCNLDCFFCYNDLGLKGRSLAKEQYLRFFEDLRELETLNLILSGGEPLAHPDFFELGARARELGFVVRVKSNGHALRGAIAKRLREEVDPFLVEVSLHGARPETHDRQTRVSGSFERLVANIAEMRELGLRVQLNSALTAWNEAELDEMMALAERLGARLQVDPEVTPRDDGDTEPLSIRPSREAVARLLRLQAEARRRAADESEPAAALRVSREGDDMLPPAAPSKKHCGAGASTVAVDPYGEVFPCVQWRRSVGNLHEQSIREIWQDRNRALAEIRRQNEAAGEMMAGLGPEGAQLSFCPGMAEAATGDPTRLYPSAREKLELQGEQRSRPRRSGLPVVP